MSDWSSWLKSNQAMAVIVLIFGGFVAIAMFALVVGLVITLSGINAGLGFSALFMLLIVGYLGLQYVEDDTAENIETTATEAVDPVTELEGQYVRGELSDKEFEHRLETILETEDDITRVDETDHASTRSREVETETNED